MIAIEEAVTAFADLVEQLAQTGGVFDEADLYRVLKNREAEQWKTGYPEKSGEYIVQIHGARVATTLDFSLKRDEDRNVWHDDWNDYKVDYWMELPAIKPESANYGS